MNRGLIRNAVFGSGSFILITIIALVTTPVIVHGLTIGGYGVYLVVTSLVGYYAIADLGLGQAVTKFVAEYHARNDLQEVSRSINSALVVQGILGLAASAVLIFLNDPLLTLLRVGEEYRGDAHLGVYLCSIGFLASMLGGTFAAVITGLQRYDVSSRVDVAVNGGLNLSLALIALLKFGLLVAITLSVIATICSAIAYYLRVRKLLPGWRPNFTPRSLAILRMFRFSGYLFLSKLSNLLTKYFVQFIVSFYLGTAAVTQFAIPTKVTVALGGLLGGGIGVIFPYASQISVTRSDQERKSAFVRAARVFAALAIPPSLLLAVCSRPLLSVWMGSEFAQHSWMVLSILALSSMIGAFTTVPNLMLMGFGQTRTIALFGCFAVVTYGFLLPSFTYAWGIFGTAIGMLVATLLNAALVIMVAAKSVGIYLPHFMDSVYRIHLVPGVVSLAAFVALFLFPDEQIYCYVAGCIALVYHVVVLVKSDALPLSEIAQLSRTLFQVSKDLPPKPKEDNDDA